MDPLTVAFAVTAFLIGAADVARASIQHARSGLDDEDEGRTW